MLIIKIKCGHARCSVSLSAGPGPRLYCISARPFASGPMIVAMVRARARWPRDTWVVVARPRSGRPLRPSGAVGLRASLSATRVGGGVVGFKFEIASHSESLRTRFFSPRHGPRYVILVTKNEAKNEAGCHQNRISSHFNCLSGIASCNLVISKIT